MTLLYVLLIAYMPLSLQQLPSSSPEVNMIAVEGVSSNIEVTCGFNNIYEREYWIINDTIYNLYIESLPYVEHESLYTLRIRTIDICLNNTTFQCVTFGNLNVIYGRVTRLIVREGKSIVIKNFNSILII